jgi:hypothetical protein
MGISRAAVLKKQTISLESMQNMKNALAITTAAAGAFSILIFIAAWAGQSEFLEHGQAYIEANNLNLPATERITGRVPLMELFFFVKWLAIILFIALVRNLSLTIFGETERPFRKNLIYTARSVLPMVVVGGVLAVTNHLWPLVPGDSASEVATGQLLRVGLAAVFVFLAWLGEGALTVKTYREEFGLSNGGATVVFLAPWLVFLLLPLFYWIYGASSNQ